MKIGCPHCQAAYSVMDRQFT
ncbi:MAG: MJ0042-type zinc finger domain-containing protein [Muribaculaceae bacterium]